MRKLSYLIFSLVLISCGNENNDDLSNISLNIYKAPEKHFSEFYPRTISSPLSTASLIDCMAILVEVPEQPLTSTCNIVDTSSTYVRTIRADFIFGYFDIVPGTQNTLNFLLPSGPQRKFHFIVFDKTTGTCPDIFAGTPTNALTSTVIARIQSLDLPPGDVQLPVNINNTTLAPQEYIVNCSFGQVGLN